MKYVKVKDATGLVRGENSSVLSVDNEALLAYKRKRELENTKEEKLNTLEKDVWEIKQMLSILLERLK